MENKEIGNAWQMTGIILAIASLIPLSIGFYKLLVYGNGEFNPYARFNMYYLKANCYVGGDGYNYIINANYATAYFVLGGILLLSALGCGALEYLARLTSVKQLENDGFTSSETEAAKIKENNRNS